MHAHPPSRLTEIALRLRLTRRTIRFRLTLLYSGLFLMAGATLLAITYLLVANSTVIGLFVNGKGGGSLAVGQAALTDRLGAQAAAQHAADLHQLLIRSGIALGITTVLAVALGWLMAGRALRPLRAMADATQQITERNLHERLALAGPSDEVKDLADTIDGLLARLEKAFDAQKHFVANASHELRTPLTLDRTLIEVALSDPDATTDELHSTLRELLASGDQQWRLIEALLTLASSERGIDRWERFDLAHIVERAVSAFRLEAERCGVRLHVSIAPAPVAGNPHLVERMIANLLDNSIRYNMAKGQVSIQAATDTGHAVLTVTNTGPSIPSHDVDRLTQPFHRLGKDRTAHPDGHGLGLSIVHAIAVAHGASLEVQPGPSGGLDVQVRFQPQPHTNGHRDPRSTSRPRPPAEPP